MSFSLTINLGTVSPNITSVRLLSCTGLTCDNGTVISGYENVLVSTFPRIVTGIPDETKTIKVESLGNCNVNQCITINGLPGTPTPTPTPTTTPTGTLSPMASFSTTTINAAKTTSGAGSQTETSGTTITVLYGTVTIKLKVWVETGYRANTSITVNGTTISPNFAGQGATPLSGTGEGNASYATFNLGIGVYTITNWTVTAVSDGSMTVAQAKLEQA